MKRTIGLPQLAIVAVLLFALAWPVRIIIHEVGHWVALQVFGAENVWLKLDLYSGFTAWEGSLPLWQHAVVSASGTLLVCIMAYIVFRMPIQDKAYRRFADILAIIWVGSEFINMTPKWNTDGNWLAQNVWGEPVQWGVLVTLGMFGAFLAMRVMEGSRQLRVRLA